MNRDDKNEQPIAVSKPRPDTSSVFDLAGFQSESRRKLLVFRAGVLHLAIFADEIATIAPWRLPTPLPGAPHAVLGVVSIQGRMLTVLDPAPLMGEDGNRESARGFIVALRGDEQLGLAIENKPDELELSTIDLILPPPEASSPLVLGVVHSGAETISLLNVKKLFPAAMQGRERRRRRF